MKAYIGKFFKKLKDAKKYARTLKGRKYIFETSEGNWVVIRFPVDIED